MHNAFYVSAGLCLVAAFLSFQRGRSPLKKEPPHP
jgi:hypothetical protein